MTGESEIPEALPGLNIKTALYYLQLDLDYYLPQLLIFARNNVDSATILRRHLDTNELEKARNLAHAINGVAATLGADDVSNATAT